MSDTLCGLPYQDHDDYSDIWTEKRLRTRKSHTCYECRVSIPVGEAAGRAKSLCDGDWFTMYRCAACLILAEWAATLTGECALWGGLGEYVAEINLGDTGAEIPETKLPSPEEHRRGWEAA